MNYAICVSDSIEKVKNYYSHSTIQYEIEDITNAYDFPVMEVQINQLIKDVVK